MEGIEGTVGQILSSLHIPGHLHLFVLLGLANIVSIAIGFLIGRGSGRGAKDGGGVPAVKPRPPERDWVDELHQHIKILREQNQHYRYLMVSLPRIIRHLNTTSDLKELAKSVVKLAGETMQTDTVHLYVYRKEDRYLEKLYAIGRDSSGIEGFEMGKVTGQP